MRYWLHNFDNILIRENDEGSFDYLNLSGNPRKFVDVNEELIRWRVFGSISGKEISDIKDINTSRVPFRELSKLDVDKMLMMYELAR